MVKPSPRAGRLLLGLSLCVGLFSAPAQAANVLVNPGFEAATPLHWVGFGGTPQLGISTEQVHGGSQAVLVSGRSASTVGIAQDVTAWLQAGRGHDVRVWVRNRQDVSASYALGIKQVDDSGTKYFGIDSRVVPPGKWVKLGGYYRHAPTGTLRSAQLYLNGPASGVEFFIDDARLEPPEPYTPSGGVDSDFIRASGRQLVVGANNTPIRLLGTNFTAYGEEGDSVDAVLKSREFDREDYAAVRAAGLNVVRLNLWYRLFEDNAAPYVYKQEGWDWLDKQIQWARQGGVRVLLSMMAPQCGYQGPGYTGTFWTGGSAHGSCQDRLKALWKAIAQRYQAEPVVAGFDLMNETLPASNAQYQAYVQSLAAAIRSVNTRHLLDVQSCFASDCEVPPLISDANVMYDFHHYDHWLHASQFSYGGDLGDSNMRYGDASSMVLPWAWDTTPGTLLENAPIPTGSTGWTYYSGRLFPIQNTKVIAAVPVFIGRRNTGKVTFDDFQIREYDSAGTLVRVVQDIDMEKAPANPHLIESIEPFIAFTGKTTTQRLSGTTGAKVIESTGHRGSASVSISNADGTYLVKMPNLTFSVRQGYQYQISGWIKGSSATGGTGALGLQLQNNKAYVKRVPYTKAYLKKSLLSYGLQFSLDHNVPLNIGEFGQNPHNYTAARGGLAWMRDTLALMAAYNISGMNWNWHSSNWGIYSNLYGFPDADALNQPLINLFKAQGITVY